ncbi:hypothetical protein RQP46_001646 [Phenoliferia psychrophenolica]
MAFPPFPHELLLAIISWIPASDHATLRACQLTNRTFHELSTPILYRHLHILWLANRGLSLLATLEAKPSLISLIVSVKVDFPRFDDLAQALRRFDDTVAQLWAAEERTWPSQLDPDHPEEDEDLLETWREDFTFYLALRDDELLHQAEEAAWAEFDTDGNARWLDPPRDEFSNDTDGRLKGGDYLEDFLASLPNLRRLDFTAFDCGIPALPRLTFLAIENNDHITRPFLPYLPNIEELVISGHFRLPSESATPPRFPKLHTLRFPHNHTASTTSLVTEFLTISRTSLKTLDIPVDFEAGAIAESLAPALSAASGLQTLSLAQDGRNTVNRSNVAEVPLFLAYLAQSSLRDLSLPFVPSHLLFASLPATIERVRVPEEIFDAPAAMAFPQLPNELLLAIISSIAPSDHATLHSCQLTSRAFREFSTPVLYGRIDITWMPTQGIALFDAFDQMPWLRDLVKSATVDFPGFQEAGRVSSRFDEIVARLWEAEKRRWSTILLDADPEEVDLRENQWRDEFEDHLEAIDEELYVQAEKEAWTDLRRTGDDEWLGMGPYDDEGRSGGGEMLAFLLASLPNLRRLDFTNWDCGSSPLPRLTYLAIQYTETCFPPRPPLLPYTRNVEELFVDGSFLLPPQYQLPTLHTLRIGPEIDTNLLSELLKKSCNTIKTLECRARP